MKKINWLPFAILMLTQVASAQNKTFTNPILPTGPDPWVIYKDGYYYYTNSTGRNLVIWKTKSVVDMKNALRKVVWTPPAGKNYSKELWAPEIHYLNHKWYMYFAADDGDNNHHRLYVIENSSQDPTQGEWVFKGQIGDKTDKWAIDASVFENKGKLYLIWSGWEGDTNGEQDIFIAQMKDPVTVSSGRVKLSSPIYGWERNGDLGANSNPSHVSVNEGPEILKHGKKLYLIYSASGCWTDNYALGMLTASVNSNLLDTASWRKSPVPVFQQSPENSVFATGHNSFFKSPDGKEDWILYHANSLPNEGCGNKRSPRTQPFKWNEDGSPNFGMPVKTGVPLPVPSGTE